MDLHLLICAAYFICLGALGAWGIHRILLLHWLNYPAPPIDPFRQSQPSVLVQLPVYNEAARIEETLRTIAGYLDEQAYESEVIVVDDGSTDETASISAEGEWLPC